MKETTYTDKSFSRKRKGKQTQFNSCNTGVNPIRTHGLGIWGNPREVMSIRVDSKLKTEATKVLKAIYGSTCRGIETHLAMLVATYKQQHIDGVYPSNTSGKIEIGNLNILREISSRRKLDWEVADVGFVPSGVCGYCEKPIGSNAYYVEYVSHKLDSLCPVCYKYQRGRGVVLKIVSRLVRK